MRMMLIRRSPSLIAIAMSVVIQATPARAADVLFTFGEMLLLYQNFEFYAYTVFEALQVANDAARLIGREPLFCEPAAIFHFRKDGDIARLADYVTGELFALTRQIGGPVDRYDDKPASAVLLLGLRAAFPCPTSGPQLAQR